MAAADEVTQIVAESHLRKVLTPAAGDVDAQVAALIAGADVEVMAQAGRLVLTFDLKRKDGAS
jgi:zona occludens toxin (predicted ATPase)